MKYTICSSARIHLYLTLTAIGRSLLEEIFQLFFFFMYIGTQWVGLFSSRCISSEKCKSIMFSDKVFHTCLRNVKGVANTVPSALEFQSLRTVCCCICSILRKEQTWLGPALNLNSRLFPLKEQAAKSDVSRADLSKIHECTPSYDLKVLV